MKKSELEDIGNGMATGGNSSAPNGHNLVGAVNVILGIVEDVEEYGLALSDLPQSEQDELAAAQEDLQYHMESLGSRLGSWTGSDGAVEDADGNVVVDLPNAASSASKTADLPDRGN